MEQEIIKGNKQDSERQLAGWGSGRKVEEGLGRGRGSGEG